jgi:DNA mismatch repair protein MutL
VQGRLIQNRSLTTAFEQAYHTLLMANRRPLGCILLEAPPGEIDVNVHPTKSEVRFADERLMFALLQRAARDTLLAHTGRQSIPTVLTAPVVRDADDWTVQRRLTLAHPERSGVAGTLSRRDWTSVEPADRTTTVGGRALPVLRVLGQVAGLFVVAEGPDGLYLIDQHAAHERVLFEEVMRAYEGRSADVQRLLTPVTLTLSPEQQTMLDACAGDLDRVGFEIEPFGVQAVAIRGVPAVLKIKDPAGAVRTILDELIEGGRGQTRLESLAISAACHGSIRAGQPLSLLEMRELVNQLEACSSPLACGHGRPTMIRMSADDLSRQFMRR